MKNKAEPEKQESSRRNVVFGAAAAVFAAELKGQAPARPRAATAPPRFAPMAPTMLNDRFENLSAELTTMVQKIAALSQEATLNNKPSSSTPLYGRDPQTWDTVKKAAQNLYRVSPSLATKPQALQTNHIGADFVFSAQPDDEAFRFQLSELLLDQAADLLERALTQRSEWSSLVATSFNIGADIQQFLELDAIHQEEADAGFYTHDTVEASAIDQAQTVTSKLSSSLVSFIDATIDAYFSSQAIAETSEAMQMVSWVSHLETYATDTAEKPLKPYSYLGKPLDVTPAIALHGTAVTAAHSLHSEAASWTAQQFEAVLAKARSVALQLGSGARAEWEKADMAFRRRRTEVARRIADLKVVEYTKLAGALNYPIQCDQIRLRFERDLRDALARVSSASNGLKKLYGYSIPLPASVIDVLNNKSSDPTAFDECLVWVRNAISFFTKFSYCDQQYVFPISLRKLMGDPSFLAGKSISPRATWTPKIQESLFPEQYHCRLRGVSLYVVPKENTVLPGLEGRYLRGVWNGSVLPPAASYCSHLPAHGVVEIHREPLVQDQVGPALSGRVSYRESRRPADVLGSKAFFNLSPFGQWKVQLSPLSTEGIDINDVQDVVLDLYLAVRTRA